MALPFNFSRLKPSRYADQQLMADEYRRTRPQLVENAPAPERVPPKRDTIDIPPLSDEDLQFAKAQGKRGGKPTIDPRILNPLERQKDYRTQVEGYEPEKASWKQQLPQMIFQALAGAGGGRGSAGLVGGAGMAIANKFINPKQPNERWKERELGRADERVGQLENESAKEAQIGNIAAQAEERKRIKPRTRSSRVLTADEGELKKGTKIATEFNPETDKYDDVAGTVLDLPNEPSVKAPLLRERTNADGSKATLKSTDNGETWTEIKDLGDAPPRVPPKDTPDYGTRTAWFRKRQSESEGEVKRLDQEIKNLKPSGQDNQGNAAYSAEEKAILDDLQAQRREARKNVEEFRTKGDEAETMPRKVEPKGVDPLKGVKWSKSKYRGSKPIEQAAKEAESRGATIVD